MEERAKVLLEALPYIQRFHGEIIVIKLGGALIEEEQLKDSIYRDIVLMDYVGMKPVVVHGGGSEISREMEKEGKESEFIEGLRVTDKETIEIIHKSLAGKINKEIVLGLEKHGGLAMGVSGIDGNLVQAEKIGGEESELGYVGEIRDINPEVVKYLLNENYIPVITPIGADTEGNSLNLNADTVAAEMAASLAAEKLLVLTDVSGVLEEPGNEDSLISRLNLEDAKALIDEGTVEGGMIPKIRSCLGALKKGVNRVHIINGRVPHALLLELLTESGIGTMIERD